MAMTLDQAVEASEIVDGLKRFGITQAEVAAVTHVSDRAVRGWRESAIRTENYDRLAELRDLVLRLSDSLSARGVAQWLRARNRLLDRERPIDVLAAGRVGEVRSAAEAFIEGSYV
jgi:transcriptional regulator with XRE-family HTH domain